MAARIDFCERIEAREPGELRPQQRERDEHQCAHVVVPNGLQGAGHGVVVQEHPQLRTCASSIVLGYR